MPDGPILKAFATLVLLVIGLAGILFLLKKFSGKKNNSHNSINLEILSRVVVQPKVYLYVIKAGLQTLLVGVSDRSISLISDLTDESAGNIDKVKNNSGIKKAGNISIIKTEAPIAAPDESPGPLTFGNFLKTTFKKSAN